MADDFPDKVVKTYCEMEPLNTWLAEAMKDFGSAFAKTFTGSLQPPPGTTTSNEASSPAREPSKPAAQLRRAVSAVYEDGSLRYADEREVVSKGMARTGGEARE